MSKSKHIAALAMPTTDSAIVEAKDRDSYTVSAFAEVADRSLHAAMARLTGGLSPAALAHAFSDWAMHLAYAPGKQMQLVDKAIRKTMRLGSYVNRCVMEGAAADRCIEPLAHDRRFDNEEWKRWPFNLIYQSFLLQQQWWHNATTGNRGVSKRHEEMVEFASRQILDMVAPSNFPLTNPEIFWRTIATSGLNLVRGWHNFLEDWERAVSGKKPAGTEKFMVGRDVAVTPGKVIFRNRLIELITIRARDG